MKKHRILILYAEVMEYFLTGILQFENDFPDIEILLFELDERKLTSYKFESNKFVYKKKSDFKTYNNFKKVCLNFDPDLLLVSGRMHPHYIRIAREMKNTGVYTVTLQDTQYNNSFRQLIIRLFSNYLYKKNFNGFWGAGSLQTAFALSLGYTVDNIFEGVYSANTNVFKQKDYFQIKNNSNKTIIYVGRFADEKNFNMLIEIFQKVNRDFNNIHQLYLIGSSDFQIDDNQIKIFPFTSSIDIIKYATNADIFCLPSKSEPWGLVIHEFASLGLPLLLSNKCGANKKFLINGFNGYEFDPFDKIDFEKKMRILLKLSNEKLKYLGANSNFLGLQHNAKIWSATLWSILLKAKNI
jgi:glycosyltransferase involved in cell wall biosynthesis